jgi:hypothetical protein
MSRGLDARASEGVSPEGRRGVRCLGSSTTAGNLREDPEGLVSRTANADGVGAGPVDHQDSLSMPPVVVRGVLERLGPVVLELRELAPRKPRGALTRCVQTGRPG